MKVFISYRRKDSHYIADRIYDWLEHELGPDNVFNDVDAIPLGRDFRGILQDAVARCDVLLTVIGPRWLGETDAAGRRRVDDPGDWVRVEIETALQRDIPVIPLLVDGARFPRGEDLPPSLQELVYRHGMPVRPDPDFRHDIGRLIKALRATEPGVSRTAPPRAAHGPGPNPVQIAEGPPEAAQGPGPNPVQIAAEPTEAAQGPGPNPVQIAAEPTEAAPGPGPNALQMADEPTEAVQGPRPNAVQMADEPTEAVQEPGPNAVQMADEPTKAVQEPGPNAVEIGDKPTEAVQGPGPNAVEIGDKPTEGGARTWSQRS